MRDNKLKYYEYLLSLIERTDDNYRMMLDLLWAKEFYSIVKNDDNRAEDGIALRLESNIINDGILGPARCLEVLISLARRCELILYSSDAAMDYKDIFWEFIRNLDLEKYNYTYWCSRGSQADFEIDEILTRWLDRKYKANGEGGIFPLKRPREDQRKIELWYQMHAYLIEKMGYKK